MPRPPRDFADWFLLFFIAVMTLILACAVIERGCYPTPNCSLPL